jgi:hypothetical protein
LKGIDQVKKGFWRGRCNGIRNLLPWGKDRKWTEVEAGILIQEDFDDQRNVSYRGYSILFQWRRARVKRFIKNMHGDIKRNKNGKLGKLFCILTDETEITNDTLRLVRSTRKGEILKKEKEWGEPDRQFARSVIKYFGDHLESIDKDCRIIPNHKTKNGYKLNAIQWVLFNYKHRKHPQAISEVLHLVANKNKFYKIEKKPYAYLNGILKIKSQNYWEQEGISEHEQIKQEETNFNPKDFDLSFLDFLKRV